MAMLIGKEYQEKKQSHGGKREKQVDTMSTCSGKTSQTIAKKHGVTEKKVRRAAKFSKAVETIEKNVGKEATKELLSNKPPISRKAVERVASQPPDKQEDAYEEFPRGKT
jgi:hypothetical protein